MGCRNITGYSQPNELVGAASSWQQRDANVRRGKRQAGRAYPLCCEEHTMGCMDSQKTMSISESKAYFLVLMYDARSSTAYTEPTPPARHHRG